MALFKSFSIYSGTLFLNAAISFLTFSLTTHKLTQIDVGTIYLYNSTTILLVPFIGVGIQFILSVDYFKLNSKIYKYQFSNALMIPVISLVLFSFIIIIFYYPIRKLLPFTNFYLFILPFNCGLIILNEVAINLIRNKGNHTLFAIFSVGKNLFEIILTLLFVFAMGLNWEGRILSTFLTSLCFGIIIIYLFKKWDLFDKRINTKRISSIAKTGLPFIPERLGVFVLAYSAGYFINFYEGTKDLGFYSVGNQIAIIVNITIIALMNVFHPYIYKNLANTPNFKNIRKAVLSFIGISLLVSLCVIVSTPLLFKIFIGNHFKEGQIYARYLTIGLFFWSIYAVFLAFLLFLKKNKTIMIISLMGMLLSICSNLINIKYFGALGATYTSMLVNFVMGTLIIFFTNKYYNLRLIFFGKNENNV